MHEPTVFYRRVAEQLVSKREGKYSDTMVLFSVLGAAAHPEYILQVSISVGSNMLCDIL